MCPHARANPEAIAGPLADLLDQVLDFSRSGAGDIFFVSHLGRSSSRDKIDNQFGLHLSCLCFLWKLRLNRGIRGSLRRITEGTQFNRPTPGLYQADQFTFNEAGDELSCPNGLKTRTRYRDRRNHGWNYKFSRKQCRGCPLRVHCLKPETRSGRTVYKSDYAAQYKAAQQRATTDEFKQVRRLHPAIERKLNEVVRWHRGRRVRYRQRLRAKLQYLLLAVVVNCKRIVRLLTPAPVSQVA